MVELLAVMQAEEAADALLKEAQNRKERAIKEALADREFKLSNLRPPQVLQPQTRSRKVDVEALKQSASRNRQRAIKLILEAMHEA